ncbi:hypothetical protein EOI86_12225 [Hwanghaeella grinnelliae]|uniref:Monooxygenase n=1 Tax=Hwanghaeella grinnelliae TaxID=2500179 RepID=A0A3S2W445_9PROT|nr:hypothetical protein [Hwanghaeella grinnelliae]RVU36006.1 hypothetical protein EOI86_12225 [Hwanghaeella grinnelliae]
MIIAVVQIPLEGPKRPRDDVVAISLKSADEIFRNVKGLRQKFYLNGDQGGGGIYFFETREDAEAWFHDGWADWMESRFGARPTLALYDNHVVLDNGAGEVRVDGKPVPFPSEASGTRGTQLSPA